MTIKEIKYKDTIVNINDIMITYVDDFTGKEYTENVEDFGYARYSEGYDNGYSSAQEDNERF